MMKSINKNGYIQFNKLKMILCILESTLHISKIIVFKLKLYNSITRWAYTRQLLRGQNLLFKVAFFCFFKKLEKSTFCFANISMRKASTEKTEYTTVMPTENPRKLSSQIFDFRNFVTEIFRHKVPYY